MRAHQSGAASCRHRSTLPRRTVKMVACLRAGVAARPMTICWALGEIAGRRVVPPLLQEPAQSIQRRGLLNFPASNPPSAKKIPLRGRRKRHTAILIRCWLARDFFHYSRLATNSLSILRTTFRYLLRFVRNFRVWRHQ